MISSNFSLCLTLGGMKLNSVVMLPDMESYGKLSCDDLIVAEEKQHDMHNQLA